MVLAMFGSGLFIPWGISLATQTRRAAPQHPILFHIQVACSVGSCMLGVMFVLAGGLASFRPGEIPASTTQMLNDLVWFCWVFPGSYFTIWCIVVGVAILLDKRQDPIFPRWSGYLSIWAGFTYIPGCMALFFKSGPFAYNGIFVWWIPDGRLLLLDPADGDPDDPGDQAPAGAARGCRSVDLRPGRDRRVRSAACGARADAKRRPDRSPPACLLGIRRCARLAWIRDGG